MPRCRQPESRGRKARALRWGQRAVVTALLLCVAEGSRGAQPPAIRRPGKVLIVRGVMTVFSLGLDELASKMEKHGFDVSIVPASVSPIVMASMKAAYRTNPNYGPVVIIGHSLGANMAPLLARQFQDARLPVDLLVLLDCTFKATVPSNVRRCVNLYQSGKHGFPAGLPVRADSASTTLINAEINAFQQQYRCANIDQSAIDHFNIDFAPWIQEIVIGEAMQVCPQRPFVAPRR